MNKIWKSHDNLEINSDKQKVLNFLSNKKNYNIWLDKLTYLDFSNLSNVFILKLIEVFKNKDLISFYFDWKFKWVESIERKIYDKLSKKLLYIDDDLLPLYKTLSNFLYWTIKKDTTDALTEFYISHKSFDDFLISNLEYVLRINNAEYSDIKMLDLPLVKSVKSIEALTIHFKNRTNNIVNNNYKFDGLSNKKDDIKSSTDIDEEEILKYQEDLAKKLNLNRDDKDLKINNKNTISKNGFELDENNRAISYTQWNVTYYDETWDDLLVQWFDEDWELDWPMWKPINRNKWKTVESNKDDNIDDSNEKLRTWLDDIFWYIKYD